MTLVARSRPPAYHRKVNGRHHRTSKHYIKPYLPYLPLLLIVGLGLLLNSAWPSQHSVLGYATDMSVQSLLDDTNTQRTTNSLSNLSINAQLDTAAQTKANDMVARDYWSHNTPDGQTPWSFITNTGYQYQTAGENLAYGFDTASDTVTGWMNSPEHRANVLNTGYQEVGFGVANSANYQGNGPETVVVAMYASPTSGIVAAAAPAVSPTPQAAQPVASSPAPAAASTPAATAPATNPAPATAAAQPASSATNKAASDAKQLVLEPASQRVSRVQLITGGSAPWSVFAISLITSLAVVIFLLRHGLFWRRVFVKSEVFVMRHPLLDAIFVTIATLGFVLTRSSGVIR